jgi:hypothetical protein
MTENKKHIIYSLLFCIVVLSLFMMCSCLPERLADKIEYSHNHFVYDTKALIVTDWGKDSTKLIMQSPAGICWYSLRDPFRKVQSDTIDLRQSENRWIFGSAKIIKQPVK